jgi:hypothetical protein
MMFMTLLAVAGLAIAGEQSGIRMPDKITVGGKQLTLNGMGLREATALKIDVYVAGLYLEQPTSDPSSIINSNETKRLVGRNDIVKAWNEGFEHNSSVPVAQIKPQIDELNSWMTGFKDGDMLMFTYIPGTGVEVDINNQRKGVIAGDDFARSLFAIWVGPKPPTGDLKRGLLGKH